MGTEGSSLPPLPTPSPSPPSLLRLNEDSLSIAKCKFMGVDPLHLLGVQRCQKIVGRIVGR